MQMTLTASHGSLAAVLGLHLGDPSRDHGPRERAEADTNPRHAPAQVIDVTPLSAQPVAQRHRPVQPAGRVHSAQRPLTYAPPARRDAPPALTWAPPAAPGHHIDYYA